MPYLIVCHEWRLLQALGTLLEGRKAPYKAPADAIHIYNDLFEYELRRLFIPKESTLDLSTAVFDGCQVRLIKLCGLLDRLVKPAFTNSHLVTDSTYPRLCALIRYLEDLNRTSPNLEPLTGLFGLASGPHQTLFRLPQDRSELKNELDMVTECNDFVGQLFNTRRESRHRSTPKAKGQVWTDTRLRDRAATVLGTLFGRFKCGVRHEVMLRLSGDLDKAILRPKLHLLLSSCPDSDRWQEALCDSCEDENSITVIHNICNDLQLYSGQGKRLRFLIEQYEVFGAWTRIALEKSCFQPSLKQSLHQLIANDAFKPLDVDVLFGNSSVTRYNTKEKRALAVQLGYCLMDFFDSELDSKRIHFLVPSGSRTQNELPYLSFSSGLPASAEPRIFRVGHPVLVSFAKILLEIDIGQSIPIEISPHDKEKNLQNWAKLYECIEKIEEQRDDSYLQAVRGCLFVHQNISQSLRCGEVCGREADLKIRKEIYREVVNKLELGLNESIPRPPNKRRRSESPPPSPTPRDELNFLWTQDQSTSTVTSTSFLGNTSWEMAVRANPNPEGKPPLKRQRAPDPGLERAPNQPFSHQANVPFNSPYPLSVNNPQVPKAIHGGTYGLFDDTTPGEYPANLRKYADDFLASHKRTYRNLIRDVYKEGDELLASGRYNPEPKFPDKGSRIKAAILDTGLELGHPDIKAQTDRIKDIRSWVNGLDGKQDRKAGDSCGHGTHVASLLLDVAPDCDVYIARIAEFNPTSPDQIAKAVIHAVMEWQVDIISMSFGFSDETEQGCDELRRAIIAAHARNILMFAAASNSGAHGAPAFPARHSNVFCIYAGDGMGNSGLMNPTAQRHSFNFCTLGEAVESAWPRALSKYPWKCRKSGTSFSTPIAAGIAAFILLYARQNMAPNEAERFKQYDKMRDMLFQMSNRRHDYNVISISNFFAKPADETRFLMKSVLAGTPWKT